MGHIHPIQAFYIYIYIYMGTVYRLIGFFCSFSCIIHSANIILGMLQGFVLYHYSNMKILLDKLKNAMHNAQKAQNIFIAISTKTRLFLQVI